MQTFPPNLECSRVPHVSSFICALPTDPSGLPFFLPSLVPAPSRSQLAATHRCPSRVSLLWILLVCPVCAPPVPPPSQLSGPAVLPKRVRVARGQHAPRPSFAGARLRSRETVRKRNDVWPLRPREGGNPVHRPDGANGQAARGQTRGAGLRDRNAGG